MESTMKQVVTINSSPSLTHRHASQLRCSGVPCPASVAFRVRYQPAAMPLCQGGGHGSATAGFPAQGRWGSIYLWQNVAGALLHHLAVGTVVVVPYPQ